MLEPAATPRPATWILHSPSPRSQPSKGCSHLHAYLADANSLPCSAPRGRDSRPPEITLPSGCHSLVFQQPCPEQVSLEEALVQRQEPQAELLDPATTRTPAIAQTTAHITPKPLPQAIGGCELYERVLGGGITNSLWSKEANSQLSSSPASHSLPFKTKEGLCQISGWEVSVNPLTTVPVTPALCPAVQTKQCWGVLFLFPPPLALG